MNHSFDVDIATKYGILEAILLDSINYWLLKNEANKKITLTTTTGHITVQEHFQNCFLMHRKFGSSHHGFRPIKKD